MSRLALAIATALVAGSAAADGFPARSGESGLLDVPDATTVGLGRGLLGAELRYDGHSSGEPDAGPFPLYVVAGLAESLEAGLTMREWGQPGDPRPARLLFGSALKLQLVRPDSYLPGFAIDVTGDRLNAGAVLGSRLIVSTAPSRGFRLAAFGGGERDSDGGALGATYGAALSLASAGGTELVAEALGGPRGANYGGAVRWRVSPTVGLSVGFNYLPDDSGFRVSFGVGIGPARKREAPAPVASPQDAGVAADAGAPGAVAFKDERPRFRLKIHPSDPSGLAARSLRHAAPTFAVGAAAKPSLAAPGTRAAAPSLDALAESQLKDLEALADARERRIRGTTEQLDGRERATEEEGARLRERQAEMLEREQQLDAREKRIAYRGPPTQQQRQLESIEAQLASQSRKLAAQERSFAPALDSARGREREAAAREDAERQEASRLAASVSGQTSRALQVEVRKQALAARSRQLAALEVRLVAKGERLDALERQLRTTSERLDVEQRRLDARGERLDLLEQLSAERNPETSARGTPAAAPAAKDKPVFVMVVKSPTAILKEAPVASAPSAAPARTGTAVEKAVAAATVVMFPTPSATLSELDAEAVDNVARLAATDRCELLVWARAQDPAAMPEAQRRATELRSRAIAAGVDEKQVVTRLTTRPGAQGVDVVVSALRDSARGAPAAAAPADPGLLSPGEAGKRQIREAVQAAQPSIEACVGEIVAGKGLQRAEGTLKLTVSPEGTVARAQTGDGPLSGEQLEKCLGTASGKWHFPRADAEYVVDVPITVIRGGATR